MFRTNDSDACFIKEYFNKRDVIKIFPTKKTTQLSGFLSYVLINYSVNTPMIAITLIIAAPP